MPINRTKVQWGLILQDIDYARIDEQAEKRKETRQEYVRRVLLADVAKAEKKAAKR